MILANKQIEEKPNPNTSLRIFVEDIYIKKKKGYANDVHFFFLFSMMKNIVPDDKTSLSPRLC